MYLVFQKLFSPYLMHRRFFTACERRMCLFRSGCVFYARSFGNTDPISTSVSHGLLDYSLGVSIILSATEMVIDC